MATSSTSFCLCLLLFVLLLLGGAQALNLASNETFAHHNLFGVTSRFHTRTTTAVDPAVIPFGDLQRNSGASHLRNAYSYLLGKTRPQSSQFILYPYDFQVNATEAFPEGAVLAFGSARDGLPLASDPRAAVFEYLKLKTNIDLDAAKAIYDSNIAVLTVSASSTDLITYEVPTLCTLLHQWVGKYQGCLDYTTFLGAGSEEPTSFVTLNPNDVQLGRLESSPGVRQFGVLVLPDINGAFLSEIVSQMSVGSPSAFERIKAFADNGGNVIAHGKGSLLLEYAQLLSAGYFDRTRTVQAVGNQVVTQGCDSSSSDFDLRTVCFSVLSDGEGELPIALVSPFPVSSDGLADASVQTLVSIDATANGNLVLYDANTGLSVGPASGVLPVLLKKDLPLSKIIINLGSGTFVETVYPWFLNSLLLVNTKPLFFDWSVNPPVIPALEVVAVEASFQVTNLFSISLDPFEFRVWKPIGTSFVSFSPACALSVPTVSTVVPTISNVDVTQTLLCSGTLASFGVANYSVTLQIDDVSVTQQKKGIWILYPAISYTFGGVTDYLEPGATTVDALLAAFIQCDYNPDPSSIYPLEGKGSYMDNVLQAQNKGETAALDVVHVAIVPLVSPLFDMSDQAAIATALRFDKDYYTSSINGIQDYIYPFTSAPEYDILDYQVLSGRGITLAADWDSPVKIYKELRNATFPSVTGGSAASLSSVGNINYQTNIDNMDLVTRQAYFGGSDLYFEHATQRLLAFADTSTPDGANAIYGDSFPPGVENPINGGREKKRWLFSRNDIYFYDFSAFGGVEYPMPDGVTNRSAVFTVDQYSPPGSCPTASQVSSPGCWGNGCAPSGLQETEYYNALLSCTEKLKYLYDDIETLSGGQVKKIHYLVPIVDTSVTSAEEVEFFEQINGEYVYNPYTEVKFVAAHNAPFLLDPADAPQGGYLRIALPATHQFSVPNPQDYYYITYSADQVAITETVYSAANNTLETTFRRGNNPNEKFGKPSQMEVNFENLTSADNFTATCELYVLTYDFSLPPPYERYDLVLTQTLNFTRNNFVSLPAVKMSMSLRRPPQASNPTVDAYMFPFENFEPYARYGVYMQELQNHRTVWTSPEVHLEKDPGLVTKNGGLSIVTHIGISSIPFREYVTTGVRQLIPAAPETGRMEWSDLWNRRWAQPVRSLFLDVPPIPPPLRNFIMTTTFELLDKDGTRKQHWNSRDPIDVRVQLKLLNNYPKYFEITACSNNSVLELSEFGVKRRLFAADLPWNDTLSASNTNVDNYVDVGYEAFYGNCFAQEGTVYLSGEQLNTVDVGRIALAELCSQASFEANSTDCQSIPAAATAVISRRPDNSTNTWNYSPFVSASYPSNYIKDNMWDLTHYDYDDNPFDKAYKYHMDNNLPNIDTGLLKPHNLVAFPLFKGAGYSMVYDKTYQNARFPSSPTGWWPDNLQNRDHTLLVGQPISNDIAVNNADLTLLLGWTDILDLQFNASDAKAVDAKKNIYTCLFNRWRANYDPTSGRNTYPRNAYMNNVVPVLPDLTSDDARLTSFACGTEFYTPKNISQFEALLETNSGSDYLYFASNLRGNAKESWNIVYNLNPLTTIKYESPQLIVQNGGRFVYWNPANGPNSFLVVDNPVSLSQAIRCDVTAIPKGFPSTAPTVNSEAYLLIRVLDQPEIAREWKLDTYNNHLGFGDAAVSVFVGGVDGSTSVVSPGGKTTVEIAFYNNAGFDWNMLGGAIESVSLGSFPISGNDLLSGFVHSIQLPTAYNFLSFSTPDEPDLLPHLNITPSSSVLGRAPLFFDFENINVVTIRDGFKALYYVEIQLASSIPERLRGRVHRIQVTLDPSYFDNLPGPSDPTGSNFHDYALQIPDILIGIPYGAAAGANAGKVFYTSGTSTGVRVSHDTPFQNLYQLAGAKYVDSLVVASNISNGLQDPAPIWDSLSTTVPFSLSTNRVTYDLTGIAPTLPLPVDPATFKPDLAEFYLLVKLNSSFVPYGTHKLVSTIEVDFHDWEALPRVWTGPFPYSIFTTGPALQGSATAQLVTPNSYRPLADQTLKVNTDGYVLIQVTVINTGSAIAYGFTALITLPPGIEVLPDSIPSNFQWEVVDGLTAGSHILKISTGSALGVGDPLTIPFVVHIPPQPTPGVVSLISDLRVQYFDEPDPPAGTLPAIQVISLSLNINVTNSLGFVASLRGNLDPSAAYAVLTLTTNASSANGLAYVWFSKGRHLPNPSQRFRGKRAPTPPANDFVYLQTTSANTLTVPLINCTTVSDFVAFVADGANTELAIVEAPEVVSLRPPCPPEGGRGTTGSSTGSRGSGSTTGRSRARDCKVRIHEINEERKRDKVEGERDKQDVWEVDLRDARENLQFVIRSFRVHGNCKDKLVLIDGGAKRFEDLIWKKDKHGNAVIDLEDGRTITITGVSIQDLKGRIEFRGDRSNAFSLPSSVSLIGTVLLASILSLLARLL